MGRWVKMQMVTQVYSAAAPYSRTKNTMYTERSRGTDRVGGLCSSLFPISSRLKELLLTRRRPGLGAELGEVISGVATKLLLG